MALPVRTRLPGHGRDRLEIGRADWCIMRTALDSVICRSTSAGFSRSRGKWLCGGQLAPPVLRNPKSAAATFSHTSEIKSKEMCCSIKDVIEDNTLRPEIRLRGAKV